MRRVATASGSDAAAHAGAAVADAGGNAVDAAIASTITAMCTDPGVIAPGSGGFIVIAPAGRHPVVIDAYAEMPGRGAPADAFGSGEHIFMRYGGATRTIVGYGSVATPGAFAGLDLAWRQYGTLPWSELVQPAIEAVENGFPLSAPSAEYLAYSHELVFGWDPPSREILHRDDGRHLLEGDTVRIPHLADSLRAIADEGVATLYGGDLGKVIADAVQANGGLLTRNDLEQYRPVIRRPVHFDLAGWQVYTNPPPAVGGATMAAVTLLATRNGFTDWSAGKIPILVRAQRAVFRYRHQRLEEGDDIEAGVAAMLDAAHAGDYRALMGSPSTTHTSAVDTDGNACAITISAGYCSGALPAGTGFYLNNSLGEMELHPSGYHGLEPGTRLISNMAPTVATHRNGALAIGSPGASRITTAVSSVLINFMLHGMALHDAIAHPRVHAEFFEGEPVIAYEPGIPVEAVDGMSVRRFPDLSMYFGGTQVAVTDTLAGLYASADPRRAGGTARGG